MSPGAIVLLLPVVNSLISKWNPDRCWMNSQIVNNTNDPLANSAGVCPLWEKSLNISVYCGISLNPSQMINKGCQQCVWKVNTNNICSNRGRHYQTRSCCCKKPMCNKEIFEDALPGWHKTVDEIKKYNSTYDLTKNIACIKASFKENQWTRKYGNLTYTVEKELLAGSSQFCFLSFQVKGKRKRLKILELGLAKGEKKKICESLAKHETQTCQTVDGERICCCAHRPDVGFCNSALYQEYGFELVMDLREIEEKQYKKDMEKAAEKLPKKLWFMNECYYNSKPFVDGFLVIVTASYILVIMILSRIYKPIDMNKEKRPETASKEISFSAEK